MNKTSNLQYVIPSEPFRASRGIPSKKRHRLVEVCVLTTYSRIVKGIPPLRFAAVGMTKIGRFSFINSLVSAAVNRIDGEKHVYRTD